MAGGQLPVVLLPIPIAVLPPPLQPTFNPFPPFSPHPSDVPFFPSLKNPLPTIKKIQDFFHL